MRSESTATWISGDPVSLSLLPNCVISSFLRSAVTDIGLSCPGGQGSSAWSEIENAERPELPLRHFCKRHRLASGSREIDRLALKIRPSFGSPLLLFHESRKMRRADQDGIAAAETDRIRLRYGQRRDAVQRGRNGP